VPVQHLGKEIEVTLSEGEVRQPQRFKLRGKEYRVAEVLATWQDHGYSGLPVRGRGPGGAAWQGGSQRQFYRLRTTEGETFEIYVDTPAGRKGRARWYAQRRLAATEQTLPRPEQPLDTPPDTTEAKGVSPP
jgi:hypothetical protein